MKCHRSPIKPIETVQVSTCIFWLKCGGGTCFIYVVLICVFIVFIYDGVKPLTLSIILIRLFCRAVRYTVDLPTTRTRLHGALFVLLLVVMLLHGATISTPLLSTTRMHDGVAAGYDRSVIADMFAQRVNRHGCY